MFKSYPCRRTPRDIAISAIAPDGHLRVVGRHGELFDKRPDDDYIMSDVSGLIISLWVFALLFSFVVAFCIIVQAGKAVICESFIQNKESIF